MSTFLFPLSRKVPFGIGILYICCFNCLVIGSIDDTSIVYTAMRPNNATRVNPTMLEKFKNSVAQLLSELTSFTTQPSFFNTTVGQAPNKVYSSYYCRGDLSPNNCHDCLSNVSTQLLTQVSLNKDFQQDWFGFNNLCMLHFANHSIFNLYEEDYVLTSPSHALSSKVPNLKEYNQTLSSAMQGLVKEAALGNWSRTNFATRVVEVMGSDDHHEKIFALVQCTPDLAAVNCSKCLGKLCSLISNCCNDIIAGGSAIHANCMMMYDNVSFFEYSNGVYNSFVFSYFHVSFVVILFMFIVT